MYSTLICILVLLLFYLTLDYLWHYIPGFMFILSFYLMHFVEKMKKKRDT